MANSLIWQEEWSTKLQERLDHPTNWKAVARVMYSDSKVINMPYIPIGSEPAVAASVSRGTAYTYTDVTITNESITIGTYRPIAIFIDRADQAQSNFIDQMEMAELQGQKINELVESLMLADHASFTNFGDTGGGALGLGSTGIVVSATNIDDIIRGVKREIFKANGQNIAARNGMFFVWRPADFELLEQFIQANGFTTSDMALKDGAVSGIKYMGVDHYVSNDFTTSHVFAGVKNVYTIGILRSTYGQIVINQDPPAGGGGPISGIGIVSRLDYGLKVWTHTTPILFDVNVV